MPLYEREGKKIYFVHIPKCGGMSVRKLLELNGWNRIPPPALFSQGGGHQLYSVWKDWEAVTDASFVFTVVRHPYVRLISHINMWFKILFDFDSQKIVDMSNSKLPFDKELFLSYFDKMGVDARDEAGNVFSIKDIPFEDAYRLVGQYQDMSSGFPLSKAEQIVKDYILKFFLEKYDKQLLDITQQELISIFLKEHMDHSQSEWMKGMYTIGMGGVTPTPSHLYVSSDTKVYKLENMNELLKDLKDKSIVSASSTFPHENARKEYLKIVHPLSFIPAEVKELLKLYQFDFEKFGYSLED